MARQRRRSRAEARRPRVHAHNHQPPQENMRDATRRRPVLPARFDMPSEPIRRPQGRQARQAAVQPVTA